MRIILPALLILSLILEVSITTIPLLLVVLICFLVIYKKIEILVYAFIFGIFIDVLSFREVGITSLFFIIFLFLVLLYQRKFEIKTLNFVGLSTFLGCLSYLFVINFRPLVLESFAGVLISLPLLILLEKRENYA